MPRHIEELATKLINVAGKSILSKAEHEVARKLMQQLKGAGMSNEEISKLSKGKWSESTVKGYTKGIKATSPNPWQDAVSVLDNVISAAVALDDVETAVEVAEALESQGVSLSDVVNLLVSADSASIPPGTLVQQNRELSETGLSPKAIAEALTLKKELEEQGLSLDCLPMLLKVAAIYGEPEKVVEALSSYGSLGEIEAQVSAAKSDLDSLNNKLASVQQQLEGTRIKLSEMEKPLQAYEKALQLGFGQKELIKLASLAEKYGGTKGVLQAVKAYTDYAEITDKIEGAESELAGLQKGTASLDIKYGHLKASIDMCNSLIHEHKFGLDAIATIFSVAKKYGDTISVLKALEVNGSTKVMTQRLQQLEGHIKEREKLLLQAEGQYQAALEHIESLNATCMKVSFEVTEVKNQLADSKNLLNVMNLINDPANSGYNEHAPYAMAIATSLLKWVKVNEGRFQNDYSIKPGLASLIRGLGG